MFDPEQRLRLQDTLYNSLNPTRLWLHQSRRNWILRVLNAYDTGNFVSAAEIGPGSGIYLQELAARSQSVLAIDIDATFLDRAVQVSAAHPNIRVLRDDIRNSALDSRSLDLILCTEVVEHIQDSESAFREMWRLLRPGGLLILTTPQRWSSMELVARIALSPALVWLPRIIYREPVEPLGHINLMTAAQLKEQLTAARFEVLEETVLGLYLPGIAECLGGTAVRLQAALERKLRHGRLKGLLWTQCYVLRALSSPAL